MTPKYDTAEGIETYLTDLAGINRLSRDRRQAGYERKERLHQFCILGRWITDTIGNMGLIIDDERMGRRVPAILGKCPPVMTEDELTLFMRGDSFSWSHAWAFPPAYATCDVCGEKWTLANCHDFQNRQGSDEASLEEWVGQPLSSIQEIPSLKDKVWHRIEQDSVYSDVYKGESRSGTSGVKWHRVPKEHIIESGDRAMLSTMIFTHKGCYKTRLGNNSRAEMETVFAKAGFAKVNLITTPNLYCPCDQCPPWYLAQVNDLPPLTIGWRKSVINIDWKASGKHLPDITADDVTKGGTHIHAWGYDKASEYLAKILPALGATP